MKYLNKILVGALAVAFVALTGCKKDFLDVNNDPNRGTDENITADLLFPQAADLAGGQLTIGNLGFAEKWMGYFAANGDFARDQTETSYGIDFNFGNTLWANYYNALFDLYLAKQKALADGNNVLAGASMILSAKLFQEVVDIWGNVPYSQAFQETKYPLPAYDKAQDIYADLQKTLDTAIGYMGTPGPLSFTSVDVVNHGDQTKWIKFANTLKLRLLIRQSNVSGFNPSAEIAKIKGANGTLNILREGETVSVNPGYTNQLNKQSPFFATYGYTATGNKAITSTSANDYIISILSATEDPRIERFFQSVSGNFVGAVYGDEPGNNPPGNQASYFGPGLIGDNFSTGAGASQDQWLIPSFESLFFRAEAIARGWVTGDGDAKTAYEDAVKESFVWLKVPNARDTAAFYMANTDIANWDNAGTSVKDRVDFIAFQKYIALCGIDPLEAWSDQRRLKFLPDGYLSVNPGRVANTLPVRLLYPQTEYTTNGDNVKQQGSINQFTSKLFWQP